MQAFLIVHPEWGVFIGASAGLTFWSEIETCGQDHAVAFSSATSAEETAQALFPTEIAFWCVAKPVTVADPGFASVEEIAAAGYKAWINERTSTVGPMQ